MNRCRVSGKKLIDIFDFGMQPLGNGFLKKNNFKNEYLYPMKVGFCNTSKMFQLNFQPNPKKMFHKDYAFYSSTSKNMQIHFKKFFNELINHRAVKKLNPFVIEIGSNDGIMLKNFKNNNYSHLGIEPSKNVASVSKKQGINTLVNFFNNETSKLILKNYGKADLIYAANVICHIPNIKNLFKNINKILSYNGIFVFEDPYLGEVIKKTSYDQIYDEHVFLFSLHSVGYLCTLFDLEIIDVKPQETHGGSMRYYIAHSDKYKKSVSVKKFISYEKKIGINYSKNFNKFIININKSKSDLIKLLKKLKKQGKNIAGYAATSKSTTILNFCNIDSNLIDYISDTTPDKQNKYSPGKHIPIKNYNYFKKNYPDYAILFAWNHKSEIFKKEKEFKKNGGKWIVFVPKVKII